MNLTYLDGNAVEPIGLGNKIIVHCCNDVGAWGAGFVLALSKKWPHVEEKYREWFSYLSITSRPFLGQIQIVYAEDGITVCNLIGQRDTGTITIGCTEISPIRYEAIYEGLVRLRERIVKSTKTDTISLHMPRMGCGLAGGNWDDVLSCINKVFWNMDIDIFVYDFK